MKSIRRALCGAVDDEADSVAAEFREFLRRVGRGPGQPVGALPYESLAGGEQIIDYLTRMKRFLDDKKAIYLGIYGMGGVGKTTLLELFNNYLVRSNARRSFAHVIFIKVSQPPKIEEIKKRVKEQIGRADLSSLQRSRFLLLLDDVWEEVDLREMDIPIPSEANKCKVIMTGRSKSFCHISGVLPQYGKRSFEVSTLSESEAWIFFQKKVGEDLDSKGGETARLAKSVAKRCGGLPLALAIVGSSMMDANVSAWSLAERNLKNSPHEQKGMKNKVLDLIKFSFDRLEHDNIRKCLLYCCLFEEDREIPKSDLITYWFVEGFLECGYSESLHEAQPRGDSNITTLVSCSLLQEGSYDIDSVTMHDVVRDMCLWITSEELNQYGKFFVYHEKDPNYTACIKTLKNIHRLSISAKYLPQEINDPEDSNPFPNLQTLLCNGSSTDRIPIEKIFFQNCAKLHVLQLRYCLLNKYFELKALLLQQLKYLDLSYTNLKDHNSLDLPHEIGTLKNLVHLDLTSTSLGKLPYQIGNLHNLEILVLADNQDLTSLPDSIGKLKKLQRLELQSTKIEKLPSTLWSLKHLKALDLSLSDINSLPNSMKNLVNLERLQLSSSKLVSLPESISALINLLELNLSSTKISILPDSIGKLTHLKVLGLSSINIEHLPNSIKNLVNLERLDLQDSELKSLPNSIGDLIKLLELNLSYTNISTLPDSIGDLIKLVELNLSNTNISTLTHSIRKFDKFESV